MKMIIFKFLKLFFDIFLLGVNTMKRILFSRGHFAYILSIIILLVLILFFLGLYCGFGKGDGEGKGEGTPVVFGTEVEGEAGVGIT